MPHKDSLATLRRSRWAMRLVGFGLVGVPARPPCGSAGPALLLVPADLGRARRRPLAARRPISPSGLLSWPVTQLKNEQRSLPSGRLSGRTVVTPPACRPRPARQRRSLGEAPSATQPPSSSTASSTPSKHLERHMAGEPGHCLTRSAIVATQLLSVGIPARVVQMVPAEGKGHTVVEVWDEASGWTVVDPTSGGVVTSRTQQGSAADLLDAPANVQWKPLRSASVSALHAARAAALLPQRPARQPGIPGTVAVPARRDAGRTLAVPRPLRERRPRVSSPWPRSTRSRPGRSQVSA